MAVEPNCFTQGDSVTWTRTESDYLPADGWVLAYILASECATYEVTASDNGDGGHLVDLTTAETAAYAAGVYTWSVRVTNAPQRVTIDQGRIEILVDFSSENFGKVEQTEAQKMLAHFDGLLLKIVSASETELENWRQKGQDPEKLLVLRNYWKDQVNLEKSAKLKAMGLGNNQLIRARFRRVSSC